MSESYLTKEKLESIKEELKELRTVRRAEIAEDLKYAKSLGDLSENAEYHEAREAQATLEQRIGYLDNLVKNAVIVKSHHSEVVEVGSTVVVAKNGDGKQTLEVVGSEEADMSAGKVSNESPIGRAMLGKKKGDTFSFEAPNGTVEYKVVDIE